VTLQQLGGNGLKLGNECYLIHASTLLLLVGKKSSDEALQGISIVGQRLNAGSE
jgi:hypothetical protein